jgi:hypothetical protein
MFPMGVEEDRLAFEREKWAAERAQKDRELELQAEAHSVAFWRNPLALAVAGAAIAAFSNAFVAWNNGRAQIALEDRKSEQARILQMITAPTPEQVRNNLDFLLKAGLVDDAEIAQDLSTFLETTSNEGFPGISLPPDLDLLQMSASEIKDYMLQHDIPLPSPPLQWSPEMRSALSPEQLEQLEQLDIFNGLFAEPKSPSR